MGDALVTVGIGATVAALVGVVKTAFPMGPQAAFVLTLALVVGFIALSVYAGRLEGDPLDWAFAGIQQFLTAVGARESVQFGVRQATGSNLTLRGG